MAGGARHQPRDRRPLPGRDRAGQAADPALSHAGGGRGGGLSAPDGSRRPAQALRRSAPGRGGRAAGDGARGDRADGLLGLLPDRLGLREVRQGLGHLRGPGARLGGGLARVLLAQHHRGRPAGLRPAVRALPQPGAGLDAGHRHRLLGQGTRPRDALRGGEVRQGLGGPDRDLRQDAAAQRHPRCRACPGPRLRHRGPAGQADPGAGDGPHQVVRRVPLRGA